MFQKFFLGLMLGAVVLLNGCIQPLDPPTPIGDEPSALSTDENMGAYRLKASDPIYLRFSGIMEQQQLEVVIDGNGEISLLHIEEPIKAAGLTTSALENKIERLYIDGGIYKHVSIHVTMTAKVFYIQGEILAPGQFPLTSGTTLSQAIAGARGYTPFAWKTRVTISRYGKVYRYNMKDIEKDPSKDVKIKAGDVIRVPQHWM